MPAPIVLPYRGPQQQLGGMNQMLFALMMNKLGQKQDLEKQQQALKAQQQMRTEERLLDYETKRQLLGEQRVYELQKEGRLPVDPRSAQQMPEGGLYEPITGTAWGAKETEWEQLPPMKLGENVIYPQRSRKTGETKYFTGRPGASVKQSVDITIGEKQLLTPAAKSETQKKLMETTSEIQNVSDTISKYKRDYLTWQGGIKHKALRVLDKVNYPLSKEDKAFLQGRRVFVEKVERDFNIYRHRITGAQAAIEELDRLKQSMYNKDLSPSEFEASANAYSQERQRAERLLKKFLREGIDTTDETGGRLFDRQFLSGQDDTIENRQNDLRKEGLNEKQIIQTLKDEGYLSDADALDMRGKELELEGMSEDEILEQLKQEGYW